MRISDWSSGVCSSDLAKQRGDTRMSGARLHFTTIAAAAAFFLAACSPAGGDGESAATPADAAAGSAAPDRYDAEAFFTTTSYSLPGGYAWSPDDSKLLVSSDETGIDRKSTRLNSSH